MPSTEDAEQAFPDDGEMAHRMHAHDWAATPFGEPSQWPSSLQTACRICLTSSLPMVVWWGEDLYFLYNDTYRPFLGTGAAGRHGLPARDLASQVMAALAPSGGSEDDVALAQYRRPATNATRPGAPAR